MAEHMTVHVAFIALRHYMLLDGAKSTFYFKHKADGLITGVVQCKTNSTKIMV